VSAQPVVEFGPPSACDPRAVFPHANSIRDATTYSAPSTPPHSYPSASLSAYLAKRPLAWHLPGSYSFPVAAGYLPAWHPSPTSCLLPLAPRHLPPGSRRLPPATTLDPKPKNLNFPPPTSRHLPPAICFPPYIFPPSASRQKTSRQKPSRQKISRHLLPVKKLPAICFPPSASRHLLPAICFPPPITCFPPPALRRLLLPSICLPPSAPRPHPSSPPSFHPPPTPPSTLPTPCPIAVSCVPADVSHAALASSTVSPLSVVPQCVAGTLSSPHALAHPVASLAASIAVDYVI